MARIVVDEPSHAAVHARASTGPVPGAGEVDVTITWPTPFPDTAYTVTACVEIDEAGESLRVRRIRSRTAVAVVVNVANGAVMPRTGTVHAIAIR